MDRLAMAMGLIEEAQNEKKRLEAYNREYEKAGCWEAQVRIMEKYSPIPRKSVINDNLKTARRLLGAEYVK